MEVKQVISFEVIKDDKRFVFSVPSDATWGLAIDAAYEVWEKVVSMTQESLKNAHAAEDKDATK